MTDIFMIKIGNALRNEIEKVALSGKTLASLQTKITFKNNKAKNNIRKIHVR